MSLFRKSMQQNAAAKARFNCVAAAVTLAIAASVPSVSVASFSQGDVTAPGGFASALAGLQTGGSPFAGGNYELNYIASDVNVDQQMFSGTGLATAATSYTGALGTNSASGYVTMGSLGFSATNTASNQGFAGAVMNGGWTDSHLFSNAALNGQSGLWIFDVNVSGSLAASGFAGYAEFAATGYKNGAQLMKNAQFSAGNSFPISTDRQAANWRVTSAPNDADVISDFMTFAVEFTWGEAFDLGIYALARAAKRSSSAVAGTSTSVVDFSNTLTWGGTTAVWANGAPVVGPFDQSSASGIDWSQPITAVPLPAMVWPFALALGAVFTGRLRRLS